MAKNKPDIRVYAHVATPVISATTIRSLIQQSARAITYNHGFSVSIHMVGSSRIRTLNRTWRKTDMPTNVLAFAAQEGMRIGKITRHDHRDLGDIMICPHVAMREAPAFNTTPQKHMARLVVHGFLHLVGYDHERDRDARAMETLEEKILASAL